ncbi:MAG: phospho-N-acetylmuramoyl-pentapeptide-transferase [bacterium]|nr:phospho-N-acetylmuramoyl-pentapeptide-transferase [bacterium]
MIWFFLIILCVFCFFTYRFYIRFIGAKLGQYVREDAPKHHMSKEGTPTAGGVVFSIFILFFSLVLNFFYSIPFYGIFVLLFLGCMLIGFYDDIMKILNKRNLGLKAREKLFLQLILTSLVFYIMSGNNDYFQVSLGVNFSSLVFHDSVVDFGWFYFVFLYFLVAGVTNATNLTDGLDGLLASLSINTLLGYMVIFLLLSDLGVVYLVFGIICFILVFLFFNFPKASVFMGDSGSMAIGSIFVYLSIVSKTESYLLFLGYIYFLIALSVILQVIYFRITNGRRLFNITPLHHHFELMGYSEKDILLRFNFVNIIFIIVGLSFILFKFI